MRKLYAKRLPEYDAPLLLDKDRILKSLKKLPPTSKIPTIVKLEISTIRKVRAIARNQGISYHAAVRDLVNDALRRVKTGKA